MYMYRVLLLTESGLTFVLRWVQLAGPAAQLIGAAVQSRQACKEAQTWRVRQLALLGVLRVIEAMDKRSSSTPELENQSTQHIIIHTIQVCKCRYSIRNSFLILDTRDTPTCCT